MIHQLIDNVGALNKTKYSKLEDADILLPRARTDSEGSAEGEENHHKNEVSEEEVSNFDDILEMVGSSGRYQIFLFLGFSLVEMSCGAMIMYYVFEIGNPGWSCPYSNQTSSKEGDCLQMLPCENFTYSTEYKSIVTEWNLICGKKYLSKFIASIFFGGLFTGSMLGGQFADMFGRKRIIMIVWGSSICFQTSLFFITNIYCYSVVRFFVGLGVGCNLSTTSVFLIEWLGPKTRVLITFGIGWSTGMAFIIFASWLLRDWRKQALATGLLTVPIYPILLYCMPESTRWLLQKHRYEEAWMWLNRAAKYNRQKVPSLQALKAVAENEFGEKHESKKYSLIDLLRTPRLAGHVLIVGYLRFSCALIGYGIASEMSDFAGNIYMNFTIPLSISTFSNLFFIYILNKFGRKLTYTLSIVLNTCLGMIPLTILSVIGLDQNIAVGIIAGATSPTMDGAWSAAAMFGQELIPTLLRNSANGFSNSMNRVGGILAPEIGLLTTVHPSGPFLVYIFLGISSTLLMWMFLPETKGRKMPDIIPDWKWPCCECGQQKDVELLEMENYKT